MQIANIESIQKGLKESHKQVIHSVKKISEERKKASEKEVRK